MKSYQLIFCLVFKEYFLMKLPFSKWYVYLAKQGAARQTPTSFIYYSIQQLSPPLPQLPLHRRVPVMV